MGREVFVDASAWVGVVLGKDQHHARATQIYRRLLSQQRPLVTTNLIIGEAYNGIRHYATQAEAGRFVASVRESGRITRVYSDEELELEAEALLRRYADHDFSLADAVSFVVMRHRRITDAFTFDRHFITAGFIQID